MCFSLEASFVGGVVLSSVGVATLKKVEKPSQILFASIPLFFGVQQISEGLVWLGLENPAYPNLKDIGMYVFLVMARVLWPMLIPLSVLFLEENVKKKKLMTIFLVMGASVSLYYSYCLLFLNVAPNIAGHHIQYISDFPEVIAVPVFIIYFIGSITPLFISSVKRMNIFGGLLFFSAAITAIFFVEFLTSVWCFFAAAISVIIYWILNESRKESFLQNVREIK